jgi:hypothetical protein
MRIMEHQSNHLQTAASAEKEIIERHLLIASQSTGNVLEDFFTGCYII